MISGGGNDPTSMPILALSAPATILSALTTNTPARIAPPATPTATAVFTPSALSGFLRPEFVLGNDFTHVDATGDLWGQERIGEDLLTNNALGFDVQVYDPNVSIFTTSNGVVVGPSDADIGKRLPKRSTMSAMGPPNRLSRGALSTSPIPCWPAGRCEGGWIGDLIDVVRTDHPATPPMGGRRRAVSW